MTLDDRIREGLESAASSVRSARPSPVDEVRRRGTRRRNLKTTGWGVGLVVVLVGILYVSGLAPSPSTDVYLADGETVVATDPLVVQGAIGPEPRFDTSVLGEEVTLQPIDEIDEVLETVAADDDGTGALQGGATFRIVLVGQTADDRRAFVTHSVVENQQQRCMWMDGAKGCREVPVDEASTYPGGLIPPRPQSMPAYGTGGPALMAWEVGREASVVLLTVEGQRVWTRPVSQLAVFTTDLRSGDSVRATVFDADGEIITRHQFTAEGGFQPTAFNCPVTTPNDPDFSPPEGYSESPGVDQGWFGNSGLWTALPVDGAYEDGESVWWSAEFDWEEEPEPSITVTWQRLDVDSDPILAVGGTSAFTEENGAHMIAGLDPEEPGCWEVTAEYKGTTVRYVYEKR